jgi:PKD repeat protein
MLKERLFLIAFITMLCTASFITRNPVQVYAQPQPTLGVEPQQNKAINFYINETFTVSVTLRNVEATEKLIGVHFRLGYNATLLRVLSVTEGPFLALFNQTSTPPYTFFAAFDEPDNELFGSHVVVGNMILPNATGQWPGPFPTGNGTIATITFQIIYQPLYPESTMTSPLNFIESKLIDSDGSEIPHEESDGYFEISPLPPIELEVDPAVYNALVRGEIFTVDININMLYPIYQLIGVHFRLGYNATLLRVLSVTEGPFLALFNQTSTPPYTFFAAFDEPDNELFGSHVVVGNMILPNATGQWPGPFPTGNGTIATITFQTLLQPTVEPQPPGGCALDFIETKLIDVEGKIIAHITSSGLYQIAPLKYPVAKFTYKPLKPSAGEVVIFDASQSYDPDYTIQNYTWNFGDGITETTQSPTTAHVYAEPGIYIVALTVTDIDGLTNSTSSSIDVGLYPPLEVEVDVGSIHFKGEIAEFNILVQEFGEPVNATMLEAKLYFNGMLLQDLSSDIEYVTTGFCRIPYTIPANAEAGTYTLLVKAEYYKVKGASIKSFIISPTLTQWDDSIVEIKNGVATISNGVTYLYLNLTAVNATITSLIENSKGEILAEISTAVGTITTRLNAINASLAGLITTSKGEILAQINTALGTLTTKLDAINATVTQVNGNTLAISTTLGDVEAKLDGIQSTATTTLYAASILSAIAVILAAVILMILRKK